MSRREIDLIEQLKAQMAAFGVLVRKCNLDDPKDYEIDDGLYKQMFDEYDYEIGVEKTRKYCKEKTIYVYHDSFECRYFSFLLPKKEPADVADETKWMICVGPFLTEVWEGLLERMTEKWRLSVSQEENLKGYYSAVPVIQSAAAFESLVFLQVSYIYGEDEKLEVCRIEDYYGQHIQSSKMWREQKESVAAEAIEGRYQLEEELMAAIAAGDTERAYAAYRSFSQFHIEWRDKSNSLRSAKNMMLTFNTLFRKAAQRAAVHPFHIDKISDSYARKIETVVFFKDLEEIAHEMIRKYCMLVRNYSLQGYSEVVRDTMNYIDCHLDCSLSLKLLAEHVSVNASYLSVRFKKEVGRSVIDYVNWKKVESSLLYLSATDMSMAEVAERVGIDDENYYSRLFKKYQGMTPRQYYSLMHSKN